MELRTYLRVVNPIVSLLILLICLWAAMVEEGNFEPGNVLSESIPTYFLAKGLFCSSALFILGKILEKMLGNTDTEAETRDS